MPSTNQPPVNQSGNDPLAAIYALNIGDFVADAFISEELAQRIETKVMKEPDKIRRQLEELVTIYSLDKTLAVIGYNASDHALVYDSLANTLAQMAQVPACHIFEWVDSDSSHRFLNLMGSTHRPNAPLQYAQDSAETRFFSHYFPKAPQASTIINNVVDLPEWQPDFRLGQTKSQSVLLAPLRKGQKTVGLLLLQSNEQDYFTAALAKLAEKTATLLVGSQDLQHLIDAVKELLAQAPEQVPASDYLRLRAEVTEAIAELSIAQQGFLEALALSIDARQDFSEGHSRAVALTAKVLAEALELNEKTIDLIFYAGLFGNVGQFKISRETVGRIGQLTDQEWDRMRNHPNVGVSLMVNLYALGEIAPYIHYQNERWDGSGAPEGLQGRNIPLGSRILALANAYQALREERPYRMQAMQHAEAIRLLQQESGKNWDPMLVELLAKVDPVELEPV